MGFLTDDLAVFFADFAVDAVYKGVGIKVIFDNPYFERTVFGGAVESSQPKAWVKDSDITGAAHGDTITINSAAYTIIEIQPDGTGITTLILSED